MNDHERCREAAPFFAAGTLEAGRRTFVEGHLAGCPECRQDLAFWVEVSAAVKGSAADGNAPTAPLERALTRIRTQPARPRLSRVRLALDLVRWQAAILRREIWLSIAAVTAIGLAAACLTDSIEVSRLLAPLIAAASLAMICGPDNDPAMELTAASPISPGKIVLARATLVFSFNLVLAGLAAALLSAVISRGTFLALILDWLGPMAFLSALALILALSFGTANAVSIAYLAWFLRYLPGGIIRQMTEALSFPALGGLAAAYRSFWESPALLLPLAAALTGLALKLAGRQSGGRRRWAAGS